MRKSMRIKNVVLVSTAMIFTATAFAQNKPKWELYGDYSYMQFNPTLSGLQSRALNGGGGGVQVNFGRYFGIKGDFQGYASTQWTLTSSGPTVTPHGTVPAGTFKSSGNMFTYLVGPTFGVHTTRFYVYGEVLLGQSNTSLYGDLVTSINNGGGKVSGSGTQHPFTTAAGGGLDWRMNKSVALRLGEMDWVGTRYSNPITDQNKQNSFRYLGGIVFTFGGE
jgi:hypothetical protein